LRGNDELQQLLRIIEPLLHLRWVCAEGFRRHLHRGFDPGHRRVFAHKPHLVHSNAGITFK
jgi:hypothetical protein